jgi:hypothetical protein
MLSNKPKQEVSIDLPLADLQTNLSKFFNVKFSYKEIKLALIRQFPISRANRIELMRYQDFENMIKPKNKEFMTYAEKLKK